MRARILLIEDNEQNLYLVTYLLEKKGYQVLSARDGIQGIETARLSHPAIILLDIQLPVMDGYAVARKLRECSELAGVPIVALTSYAMAGDREKALVAGCTGYIEKPINPETFLTQIEEHLEQSRGGGSLK